MPAAVAPVADVMATFPAPWALCGGWAVDAWLGRLTRDHGDVDLSIFVQDEHAIFDHLEGWQLLAHDAVLPAGDGAWWDGRRHLHVPAHIHARPPDRAGTIPPDGIATTEDGFFLDIQLDDRSDDQWILSRDPRIQVPLSEAVAECPWGVPAVLPEVLLFFKAKDLRRRDRLDFERLLPLLGSSRREWLHDAVAQLEHPWLADLSAKSSEASSA
jgi:hypothetical protein